MYKKHKKKSQNLGLDSDSFSFLVDSNFHGKLKKVKR